LDSANNPHISYTDGTNGILKYAGWTGSEWNVQTVDSTGIVGAYSSIEADSANNLHISYFDQTNGDLKYAKGIQSSPSPTPTPTPTPSPTPTITPTRPPYVGGTFITLNTNQTPTIIVLIVASIAIISALYLATKTTKKQKQK